MPRIQILLSIILFFVSTSSIFAQKSKSKAQEFHDIAYDHYQHQEYEKALVNIKKAIKLNPSSPNYISLETYIYANQKKYDAIHKAAAKGISLFPDFQDFYDVDMVAYFFQGNMEKSLERAREYEKLNPVQERFYNNYLQILDTMELDNEIPPIFEKYIDLKANDEITDSSLEYESDIYQLGSRGYQATQNYDKALECIQKSISLRDDQFQYYFERGKVYLKMGNKDLAKLDFEKAISLTENEKELEKIRKFLN